MTHGKCVFSAYFSDKIVPFAASVRFFFMVLSDTDLKERNHLGNYFANKLL